jgi:ATP-dependent helicase HrpB
VDFAGFAMNLSPLPIDQHLEKVLEAYTNHQSVVLTASPGSGKTTRIPPAILRSLPSEKMLLVLEPRRVAASAAAKRIAEEQKWELGNQVGFHVRFEKRASAATRILFQTEGLFARTLTNTNFMDKVAAVILDEFHERHLWTDLSLGLLREYQELQYPDLKLVLMSATLDPKPLLEYLKNPVHLDVPGIVHPMILKPSLKPQLIASSPELTNRLADLVKEAISNDQGDVLVFLPGKKEISFLANALEPWLSSQNVILQQLHGSLPFAEQRDVLSPSERRRVVLSTNVAESSVTVPGVRVVIDSGLERVAELHPKTRLPMLALRRISLASAKQRSGRAAREGAGIVYQAWTKWEERGFAAQLPPELLRSDLNEVLLILSSIGVTDPLKFAWINQPKKESVEQCLDFLKLSGALDSDGRISLLGKRALQTPTGVRAALFLESARKKAATSLWPLEISLLLDQPSRGLSYSYESEENDLWGQLYEAREHSGFRREAELRQLVLHFGMEKREAAPLDTIPWSTDCVRALLEAFPDRICRRRQPQQPQAIMAGGRGVRLSEDSTVRSSEYFIALDVREGKDPSESLVTTAVECPEELIKNRLLPQAEEKTIVSWSESDGRFWCDSVFLWKEIPLGPRKRVPAKPDQVDLGPILHERLGLLRQRNSSLDQWLIRFEQWCRASGGTIETRLSEEKIRAALGLAAFGENSLEALWDKNFIPFFEQQLTKPEKEQLERDCPQSWQLRNGRRLPILFSGDQGPYVEVRIQMVLGETKVPLVAGQPLTVVLLAPNNRPIQITRDLAGFWTSSYPEIRKELRGRYPKHSWPENPLSDNPPPKGH